MIHLKLTEQGFRRLHESIKGKKTMVVTNDLVQILVDYSLLLATAKNNGWKYTTPETRRNSKELT